MKYLILIYQNPRSREAWESFSEAEQAEAFGAYAALDERLAERGELIVSEALADPSLGIAVTEAGAMATDGPFAEAKEQLAGFYLIEVESEARAVEVAGQIPGAGSLTVELRPILDWKAPEQ